MKKRILVGLGAALLCSLAAAQETIETGAVAVCTGTNEGPPVEFVEGAWPTSLTLEDCAITNPAPPPAPPAGCDEIDTWVTFLDEMDDSSRWSTGTVVPGFSGNALSFGSSISECRLESTCPQGIVQNSISYAIGWWARSTDRRAHQRFASSQASWAGEGYAYHFRALGFGSSPDYELRMYDSTGQASGRLAKTTIGVPPDGTWRFVVYAQHASDSRAHIFVDGVDVSDHSGSILLNQPFQTSGRFSIGWVVNGNLELDRMQVLQGIDYGLLAADHYDCEVSG